MAREVRLLGALLGQVIIEQAGEATYETVERIRRRAIALRRADDPVARERQATDLDELGLGATEAVVSAFALYFALVNLAEARGRVRALRRRERAARDGLLDDSVAEAIGRLRAAGHAEADLDAMLARLRIRPRPGDGPRSSPCGAARSCWSASTTRG
jgi:phosphoenolpyruvate carboxylase